MSKSLYRRMTCGKKMTTKSVIVTITNMIDAMDRQIVQTHRPTVVCGNAPLDTNDILLLIEKKQ